MIQEEIIDSGRSFRPEERECCGDLPKSRDFIEEEVLYGKHLGIIEGRKEEDSEFRGVVKGGFNKEGGEEEEEERGEEGDEEG